MPQPQPQPQPTCEARIDASMLSHMETIQALWERHKTDPEVYVYQSTPTGDVEIGRWDDYGLSFTYVDAEDAFGGQGYWKYLITWGGPEIQLRFYADPSANFRLRRSQFFLADWFDSACREIPGQWSELIEEIWQDWVDCGLPQSRFECEDPEVIAFLREGDRIAARF